MRFLDGDCPMSRTGEPFRTFGFGAIAGLSFFVGCGTLEITISGLGATGGGAGLLFAMTNFGLGATGGFLISAAEVMIPRGARFPTRPPQSVLPVPSIVSGVWAEEKGPRSACIPLRGREAQPARRTKDAAGSRDPVALPGASGRRRADGQARARAVLTSASPARVPSSPNKISAPGAPC